MRHLPYREVWAIDTEFNFRPSPAYASPNDPQPEGSIQHPVCLVGHELYSGRKVELFEGEFGDSPPFDVGDDVLFIAFNATAEWLTFLALGWTLPSRVFDPYIEYRHHICGIPGVDLPVKGNKSFLAALQHFGIQTGVTAAHKKEEIDLVLRGGPWTPEERERILTYCGSDVTPLFRLTECLLEVDCEKRVGCHGRPLRSDPRGLAQAIHRGRFSLAAARMTHTGVPIDTELLGRIRKSWSGLKVSLIEAMDDVGVYEGTHFRHARFEKFVLEQGIPWPTLPSGKLRDDRKAWTDMAQRFPEKLDRLAQLKHMVGELRLEKLEVGEDGRNRSSLWMFGTKTSRNAPSQNRFIFGLTAWVRHLIRPGPGMALAYMDWKNQELHIAGVLSQDPQLLGMLRADDPYIEFAIRAGMAPAGATKATHPDVRAICKTLFLATNYGGGAGLFTVRAGITPVRAQYILNLQRRTLSRYAEWSSDVINEARLLGRLHTVFGWREFTEGMTATSLRNYMMQSNGAEMMRLACELATERGITVCCPVHDAILIEAPIGEIDAAVATAREAMEEASREVLSGHVIGVDVDVVRWPGHYLPGKGEEMWERVLRTVNE